MPTHTQFKNVSYAGQSLLSEQLECNLQSFFEWGFNNIGGFYNVQIPASGGYGGDYSRLRLSDDSRFTAGKAWESVRKNWVWESGVEGSLQPIQISGVYVNGAYHSSAETGAFAHYIDYPNGRIVFNSPIATGSQVTCNYSYKLYNILKATDDTWEKIQFDSLRVDHSHFLQYGSGQWSGRREQMIQLPAVVVESIPSVKQVGYELGNGKRTLQQDVLFHILTEKKRDRNFLHDVITEQWNKTLIAFDMNAINQAKVYPLDTKGSIRTGAKTYPQLVAGTGEGGYAWKNFYMTNTFSLLHEDKLPLYYSTVRATFQIIV